MLPTAFYKHQVPMQSNAAGQLTVPGEIHRQCTCGKKAMPEAKSSTNQAVVVQSECGRANVSVLEHLRQCCSYPSQPEGARLEQCTSLLGHSAQTEPQHLLLQECGA